LPTVTCGPNSRREILCHPLGDPRIHAVAQGPSPMSRLRPDTRERLGAAMLPGCCHRQNSHPTGTRVAAGDFTTSSARRAKSSNLCAFFRASRRRHANPSPRALIGFQVEPRRRRHARPLCPRHGGIRASIRSDHALVRPDPWSASSRPAGLDPRTGSSKSPSRYFATVAARDSMHGATQLSPRMVSSTERRTP